MELSRLKKIYQLCIKQSKYDDAYAAIWNMCREDMKQTYPLLVELRNEVTNYANKNGWNMDLSKILRKAYFLSAKDKFDDFCIALEWDRSPEKRFYLPRRKQLLPIVNALQRLADDELDLLAISCPPGVGKTTLAIFFLVWLAGKEPNQPILGGSHSNSFLHGVYEECLRIIQGSDEYNWQEIFNTIKLSRTNAKDMRIDVDQKQRFETLEFSSIGSGNAGKVRAATLLYCDDLVDGIETALSKERLDKLWQQYYTDLRQRKIGNCKELHIATRWSIHDVIGRLEQQYGQNERAEFIRFAALDENDESNFDYPYGVGFTTEFYREQREIMDDASWRALYMNEPIEREGQLYNYDELRHYFELPDGEPDAILAVCDTKDRGTDFCVMPIAYQYGSDFYIEDFVCDNSNPNIVEPRLISKLLQHKVKMARFESNSAGGKVAEIIQKEIKKKNGTTKITTKYSTSNKETRIIVDSNFAKERFLFKDKSVYKTNKEYRTAMNFLCNYTMMGRNKHDDVPDAISMLVNFIQSFEMNRAEILRRPF